MFLAWKLIRILAELLPVVRTISEDIRDLRSDIRLLGSKSSPEDAVSPGVSLTSQEDPKDPVSVLDPELSGSITAETETLGHGEVDTEEVDVEKVVTTGEEG